MIFFLKGFVVAEKIDVKKGDVVKFNVARGEPVDAKVTAVKGKVIDVEFEYEGRDVVIVGACEGKTGDTWFIPAPTDTKNP